MNTFKRSILIAIFAVGFAYIEATIVVYLREIFYSEGFAFPLPDIITDPRWIKLIWIEVGREVASLIVLASGAWLFGKNLRTRIAYFLLAFAVWDIFYYIWLKVLIGWPAGLADWDILFLIPITWASPVYAPALISLVMIAMAAVILHGEWRGKPLRMRKTELAAIFIICVLIIAMFCRAGIHVAEAGYTSYFSAPLFFALVALVCTIFMRSCIRRSTRHQIPNFE